MPEFNIQVGVTTKVNAPNIEQARDRALVRFSDRYSSGNLQPVVQNMPTPAPMLSVVSELGVAFNVRIVNKGGNYGRDFCLTHESPDPLVEFYDSTGGGSVHGHKVSSYYASTLQKSRHRGGINLDGGNPGWTIDTKTHHLVMLWLDHHLRRDLWALPAYS